MVDKKHYLFTLPTEVRTNIYQILFRGLRLRVDAQAMRYVYGRVKTHERSFLALFKAEDTAVIRTCRHVLTEAMGYLAAATTIRVQNLFDRRDPLKFIPATFLARIRNIEIDFEAFVHIERKQLKALEHVTLTRNVIFDTRAVDRVCHLFSCNDCCGKELIVEDAIEDLDSFTWFKTQFLHLAKEEGWNVQLNVRRVLVPDDCRVVSHRALFYSSY